MSHRAPGPASLAVAVLLAACGNGSPAPSGAASGAPVAEKPPATASSAPAASTPEPAPASASAPAPASAPPPAATPASPAVTASASARPPTRSGAPDAGALDAGATDAGATDAGAADAGAAAGQAQQVAQQVDAIFAGKKTFSARFQQKYTQKVTGTVKDSTGLVFVERPDKISFRYDPPNDSRIVSDGVTIKVYVPADKQMFVTPMGKTQYPGALAFMLGNGIAGSFAFVLDSRAGNLVLKGKPLVPNPSYETVAFFIDSAALGRKDPAAIAAVLIQDALGNRNRFDFTGASQPPTIAPSEFTFTPPPGTTTTGP